MKTTTLGLALLMALCAGSPSQEPEAAVELVRLPSKGIQPQVWRDANGTIHTLYAQSSGDLFYVQRREQRRDWSTPVKVNSGEGRAKGGAIAAAQMAVAPEGTVHVVWIDPALSKIYYTHKRLDSAVFNEQRDLLPVPMAGLEAGPSVAAGANGDVVVSWHAGDFASETDRDVQVVASTDAGETFSKPRAAKTGLGACACCGMDSLFTDDGRLLIFYRAAKEGIDRDMVLLVSEDSGRTFETQLVHRWSLAACPVSTSAVIEAHEPALTWETEGKVFLAWARQLDRPIEIAAAPSADSEPVREKNPVAAISSAGQILTVWGEGYGWRSGGTLKWRIFDSTGIPLTPAVSTGETIPDFSTAAAVGRSDGSFLIIY